MDIMIYLPDSFKHTELISKFLIILSDFPRKKFVKEWPKVIERCYKIAFHDQVSLGKVISLLGTFQGPLKCSCTFLRVDHFSPHMEAL